MRVLAWCVFVLAPLAVEAAGDPGRGARLFHPCAHCHSTKPGEQLVGPSLAKIFDGKAASVEGFTQSTASPVPEL